MGCCSAFLRTITWIFNAYFGIIGLASIAYGAFSTYTLFLINDERTIKDFLTILPSVVIFVLGVLLVVLIIVGCCAVFRQAICCLNTYTILLFILCLCHTGVGVYSLLTYSPDRSRYLLRDAISRDIGYSVENYRADPTRMDAIQNWMKCCGNENPHEDYEYYVSEFPSSCCDDAITCLRSSPTRHREGCTDMVFAFTFGTNYYLGWVAIVIAASELIAACLGVCLTCVVWRSSRSYSGNKI